LRAFLRDTLLIVVAAVVITLLIQVTVQKSSVIGYCMEPGLQDGQQLLINKVVLEVKNGAVYVNGSKLDEPYIKEPPTYNFQQKKIPENEYFVLGDNRNNASDSHNGCTVPRQNIIVKAGLSIWPPSEWGLVPNYSLNEQLESSGSK